MAVAAVVIAGASIYYLRPNLGPRPVTVAKTVIRHPVQRPNDIVLYTFRGAQLGWAAVGQPLNDESGTVSIYRTVDGARSWEAELTVPTALLFATFDSFQFVDSSRGALIAGNPPALLSTLDGGLHWSAKTLPSPDTRYVRFLDSWSALAWSAPAVPNARGQLYWTADSGDSWTNGPSLPPHANPVPVFRNHLEGWVGVDDPSRARVYSTADGGATWTEHYVPSSAGSTRVSTVPRLLPGSGVLVQVFSPSSSANWYRTFDGGTSWIPVVEPIPSSDFPNYVFVDSTHWWEVVSAELYKTADAGQTWTDFARAPVGLGVIQVTDSRHAWAGLDEGYGTELLYTSDGGAHWRAVNVPDPMA